MFFLYLCCSRTVILRVCSTFAYLVASWAYTEHVLSKLVTLSWLFCVFLSQCFVSCENQIITYDMKCWNWKPMTQICNKVAKSIQIWKIRFALSRVCSVFITANMTLSSQWKHIERSPILEEMNSLIKSRALSKYWNQILQLFSGPYRRNWSMGLRR